MALRKLDPNVMVEDQKENRSIEKKERSGSEELWWETFSQACEGRDLSPGTLKNPESLLQEKERSGSEELWWETFSQACEGRDLSPGRLKLLKNPESFLQEKALLGLENYGQGQEPVTSCSRNDVWTDDFPGRLDKGLHKAIGKYKAAAKSGVESGPYVICDYVPFFVFEAWYKHTESVWRIAFQYTNSLGGTVLLYGDPSFLHEFISQWFGHGMSDSVTAILDGEASRKYFRLLGSSRIILANGFHKEPDFIVQPKGWKSKCAPLIGEVAYANESLETLKAELILEAMQGYAKVAYGVKVTKKNDSADLKLRFLERSSGAFTRDIDFSPGVCNAPGDPTFLVPLPLSTLFDGCTSDERLLKSVVNFDLFELQQEVVDLLQNNTVEYVWFSNVEQASRDDGKPLLGVKKDKVQKKPGRERVAKQTKAKTLFALVKSLVGWTPK